MVLFTHAVKKIKDVAHKNGDVDGTCKQVLNMINSLPKLGPNSRLETFPKHGSVVDFY